MSLMDMAKNASKGFANTVFKEITGADPQAILTTIKSGGSIPYRNSWGDLNNHLIAKFYQVDRDGKPLSFEMIQAVFVADVSLEVGLNWQSPFENSGAESKAPALMSMLQSGAFQQVIDSLGGKAQEVFGDTVKQATGRTGITRLNSTQVFSGMPPLKIQGNLLFRAWNNAVNEVEAPLNTLMGWSLPVQLEKTDTLATGLAKYATGNSNKSLIETIMPSEAPTMIAMTYKGRTFSPMVIENISIPLGSPVDAYGNFTQLVVPITLSSLWAFDREDWANTLKKGF